MTLWCKSFSILRCLLLFPSSGSLISLLNEARAQAGKPAWDQSVQAAMGKVLRLLHPISAIRHRLAFFVGNAKQSLRTKVSGRS